MLLAGSLSPAPGFALKDSAGAEVRLSKLRGHVVLVNFWATHCAPCVQEMPWLAEFHARYARRKFTVVGVSMDESWGDVRAFLAKKPVPYPVALGSDPVADAYKVEAMPASFLVDRRGRIVWTHVGLVDRAALEAVIRRHTK